MASARLTQRLHSPLEAKQFQGFASRRRRKRRSSPSARAQRRSATQAERGTGPNLQVNGRIIPKRIHVRVEHVHPSRCKEEFLKRVKANDAFKHEAKVKGGACLLRSICQHDQSKQAAARPIVYVTDIPNCNRTSVHILSVKPGVQTNISVVERRLSTDNC